MTCASCRFFNHRGKSEQGTCHCLPPSVDGFPMVMPSSWCGKHEIKEPVATSLPARDGVPAFVPPAKKTWREWLGV
jgi:hypothetical protein